MADNATVASTQLSPPRLGWEIVDRPRLLKRLVEAETLAFVSGPAGSGKSTLLAQAYATVPRAAWLSLSPGDNDPTQLWSAITESVAEVIPDFGSTYRIRLSTPAPRVLDAIVPAAINELAANGQALCLFIDDLHLLTDQECVRSLELFVEQIPSNVTVVLASRASVPFPMRRHSLYGRAVFIGASDLAMDSEEADAMLTASGLDFDRSQTDRLQARLEGWVAGLRWAALALQDEPDLDRFITASGSPDSDIAGYLVEEVLDHQPREQREFMLETSILHGLNGGICDAVRDRTDSAVLLEQLERSNALVTRADRRDGWYRYHHLARELLAARLEREMPGSVPVLHRRAAAWCNEHGEVRSAVEHALEAGDRTWAADLLCGSWWDLLNKGQAQTVAMLLGRFEAGEVHAYPPLAAAAALFYGIGGDEARARFFCTSALQGDFDGTPPDGSANIESTRAIVRGSLVFEGVEQSLRDGELAYAHEPADSPWRPLAAMMVAVGHIWSGDPMNAVPYLTEVATADTSQIIVVYALAELALARLEGGDAEGALATAEQACALAHDSGVETLLSTAGAHAAAALAHLGLGDHHAAAAHLDAAEGPVRAVEHALPVDSMRMRLLLADASIQLGRLDAAEVYLDRAAHSETLIADTGALSDQLTALQRRLEQAKTDTLPEFDLTDREMEVLELLATDLTTRQIGSELYLSMNTAKTYQRNVYKKLGVNTRADALITARRAKLIPERTLDV